MQQMKTFDYLAVVPARSGSKRLPNKNFLSFGGIPLYEHTLIQAELVTNISNVLFSTDSDEQKNRAVNSGYFSPFLRPQHLSTDNITNVDVCKHALSWLKENYGYNYRNIILLQPTSPLRTSKDISGAIAAFESGKAPTLSSAFPLFQKKHPTIFIPNKDSLEDEVISLYSSTAFPEQPKGYYRLNSSIYISKVDWLYTHSSFHSSPKTIFP